MLVNASRHPMTPATHLGDGTPLAPLATIRARHVRRIQVALGDALPLKAEGLFVEYVNDEISWGDLATVKEWLAWAEAFEELHGPIPDAPPHHEEVPMSELSQLRAQVFAEAVQQENGNWQFEGRDRHSWDAEVDHLRVMWQRDPIENAHYRDYMMDAQEVADTLVMLDGNIQPAPEYRP